MTTNEFPTVNDSGVANDSNTNTPIASAQVADAPKTPSESLQTNDVIELQAFLERRTWIENKIQLFESMPTVDVFAGTEALVGTSERIPGLPPKEQLDAWVQQVDQIDSETQQFDQGDMNRLKDFAKAKSEQNLSPADTDLIEVTLTTLLALDKLMHLLRKRAESLDMMGLRLQWEDQRIAAWDAFHQISKDLELFTSSSNWTLFIYDAHPSPPTSTLEHTLPETMFPQVLSPLARTNRRKLAESLSNDAKNLTSRLITYRRDLLPRPGVTLDRMIETTSEKLPDVVLDEQDKLENDSEALDGLDKFIPNLQMQWKKADEFYAELKKDQAVASILLDEVARAKAQHPSAALDQTFTSRCAALSSRLSAIGHPSTMIPRPKHALAPQQVACNENIHSILSSELAIALKLARKAQMKASEYHTLSKAVDRAVSLSAEASQHIASYEQFILRLVNGTVLPDGDGAPPDFTDERCLQPTQHASYIALLPSLVEEIETADANARRVVTDIRTVLLELRSATLEPSFAENCSHAADSLFERLTEASEAKASAVRNVDLLRRARTIGACTADVMLQISSLRDQITDAIESQQWKAALGRNGAPLTPDSPRAEIEASTPAISTATAVDKISNIASFVTTEVRVPLENLASRLHAIVRDRLFADSEEALSNLEGLRDLLSAWQRVQAQSEMMRGVLSETYDIEGGLDELREEIQRVVDNTLQAPSWQSDLSRQNEFIAAVEDSRSKVTTFVDSLAARVPLVSSRASLLPLPLSHSYSSSLHSLPISTRAANSDALHRKLATLDQVVRTDVNAMSTSLNGGLESLRRKLDLLALAELARLLDDQLRTATHKLQSAHEKLTEITQSGDALLEHVEGPSIDSMRELDTKFAELLKLLDQIVSEHTPAVSSASDAALHTLKRMRSSPGVHDATVHDDILSRRSRAFELVEGRAHNFLHGIASLRTKLVEGRRQAEQRLHELMLQRERKEMERRGSLSKAELEASRRALLESEHRAQSNLDEHRRRWEEEHKTIEEVPEDVFGFAESLSHDDQTPLHARIASLRAELRAIGIHAAARPFSDPSNPSRDQNLPSLAHAKTMRDSLNSVSASFANLSLEASHTASDDPSTSELKSLKFEIDASQALLSRVDHLATFAAKVDSCDAALSDLLEHLDTFPSTPAELASSHVSDIKKPPVEQLKSRLKFCEAGMSTLSTASDEVMDDERVKAEKVRLEQTWAELADMAKDKTRPPPRNSSSTSRASMPRSSAGASSSSSRLAPTKETPRKVSGPKPTTPTDALPTRTERSRLRTTSSSTSLASRKPFFPPRQPSISSRPSFSGAATPSRASSRLSTRSVSGPTATTTTTIMPSTPSNSSLYASTFSSRQRTNSSNSISSPSIAMSAASLSTPDFFASRRSRRLSNAATSRGRTASPTPSVVSTTSNTSKLAARVPTAAKRGPRGSLSHLPRPTTPNTTLASRRSVSISADRRPKIRKPYVPNSKNRLDVAVGAVMNNLPADVPIEAIPVSAAPSGDNSAGSAAVAAPPRWHDESGKYWIGDTDPKLCFCRILRSQTVMVRVGGGWVELSKFIRDHFAHLFLIDPVGTSPERATPRPRNEERWISSATLLEAENNKSELAPSLNMATHIPRPSTPIVRSPLFVPGSSPSIGTSGGGKSSVNGWSPPGLRPQSPGSSPLMPMHFIRRASVEPGAAVPGGNVAYPPPLTAVGAVSSARGLVPSSTPAPKAGTSSQHHLSTPTPTRHVWR